MTKKELEQENERLKQLLRDIVRNIDVTLTHQPSAEIITLKEIKNVILLEVQK